MTTPEMEHATGLVRFMALVDTTQFLSQNFANEYDQERLAALAMDVFDHVAGEVEKFGGGLKEIKSVFRAADHFATACIKEFKEQVAEGTLPAERPDVLNEDIE